MRAWLLVLALLLAATRPAGALQDPQIEPLLVELKIGRLASKTVPAQRAGNDVLIPMLQFLELAEVGRKQGADGSVTAVFQPGNVTLTVDPQRRRLVVDGRQRPLSPREFLVQDGELFVSTAVLGSVLTLEWEISWPDLEVSVINPDNLPIARRLRRESLAGARLATGPGTQAEGQLRDPPSAVDGLVADYSLLVPTNPGPKAGAYNLGLGLNVLRGSFEARIQNQGSLETGQVRLDVGWTGVWRDNRWLSQLRLGDGYASGPRTRAIRGIALGNVPFRRPSILGELPFGGSLGPGWQVEAYRGGRLISFDSVNALGQFSIDVPIQYGENPVDFIAYGPFGEVKQFSRTYRVALDVIQARRFEYGVSAGACRLAAPCTATANVDLRYGLSRRWTIQAGMDQFWRDSLPNLSHPYAGIVGNLTNALSFEAEAVKDAVVRGLLRVEPSVAFQFLAEATRFARNVDQPILTPAGREQQFTLFARLQPLGASQSWLYFDGGVDWVENLEERATTARLGASIQPGQLRLIPSVRWRTTQPKNLPDAPKTTKTTWGLNAILLPLPQLGGFLGRVTARGNIDFDTPADPFSASGYFSRPVSRYLRVELGASWLRNERASLSLFFTADLPGVRAYTTIERPATGDVRATQFVQGSLLYDRAYQTVAANAGPSINQAGVSGRAFLDLNDNGSYDRNEYVLPDVGVTVGIFSQRTNRRGEFRVWQLPAYEPMLASIDTTTLASPLWLPSYGAIGFETQPNRYMTLNIPVLAGGVIDGSVVRSSPEGDLPVPGVTVILRHLKTGRVRTLTTFSDGTFYALSIRPGEWEAQVDPRAVERFGRTADRMRFTLKSSLQGESVSGIVLRIR